MIVGAVITYNLKHETEKSAARVFRLHTAIAKEREAIAYLKAEWSVLSQPGRLQQLIDLFGAGVRDALAAQLALAPPLWQEVQQDLAWLADLAQRRQPFQAVVHCLCTDL